MASNNRKALRWLPKNADERTRNSSRSQQSAGSLHGKRKGDTRKIQETLDDMFINVFDSEIIHSVAHSCGWDLSKSIEALIMLSEDDKGADFKIKTMSREAVPGLKENSPDSLKKNIYDGSNKLLLNTPSTSTTPSKNESTRIVKSKSVMMNAGHSKIKVMYKCQNDPDFSDDDADIVIEEEKEMEENETESGFENVSSQSMCQFLTHVIPSKQDTLRNFPKPSGHTGLPMVSKSHNSTTKCKESLSGNKEVVSNTLSSSASVSKKTKHWPQFERIKKQINENIKVMVLLRGVPGSGKTSLARHIIKVTYGENHHKYIFSTDEYFVLIGRGKYTFDPKLLPEAHKWNQQRVHLEARKGTNPILVDNTNSEAWELKPYVESAVEYGYNLELIEPRTSWRYNSIELERKNIHNVSRRKIEEMLIRFERDLTPGKLMTLFDLRYAAHNIPPQYTQQLTNVLFSKKDSFMNNPKRKSKVKKEMEGTANTGAKNNCQQNNMSNTKQMSPVCQNKESPEKLICSWEEILSKLDNPNPVSCSEAEDSSNSDNKSSVFESSTYKTFYFPDGNHETNSDILSNEKYSAFSVGKDNQLENLNANENNQLLDNGSGEENIELGESVNDWENESACNDKISKLDNLCDVTNSHDMSEICHTVCTDYVLVMNDGTLLPQKSYSEEENFVNVSLENRRSWEYILLTKDSKLILDCRKCSQEKSDSGRVCASEVCHTTQHLNNKETISFIQGTQSKNVPTKFLPWPDGDLQESVSQFKVLDDVNTMTSKDNSLEFLDLKSNRMNIAFAGIDASPDQSCTSDTNIRNDNSSLRDQESDDKFDLLLELSPPKSVMNSQDMLLSGENGARGVIMEAEQNERIFIQCESKSVYDEQEIKLSEKALNSSEGISKLEAEESCHENFGIHVTQSITTVQTNSGLEYNQTELLVDTSIMSEGEKVILFNRSIETKPERLDGHDNNVKDILSQWEEGTGWDDREEIDNCEKIKQNADCTTPKPARNNRRVYVSSSPLKLSTENLVEKDLEPTVSGIWSVVDEPLQSWEVTNDQEENLECKEVRIEAQPQREQFAFEKEPELDKNVSLKHLEMPADAELRGETDNNSLSFTKDFKTCSNDLFLYQENLPSISNDSSGADKLIGSAECVKDTIDSSTNTHHLDFRVLSSINDGKEISDLEYKIVSAYGRNIIENEDMTSAQNSRKVLPVLLLDKSSMTSDECFVSETENIREQLNELIHMFPSCSVDDLLEIFERCNKDINWTVDLLLESASQGIVISSASTLSQAETQSDPLDGIKSFSTIEKDALNNPILRSGDTDSFSTSGSSSSVVLSEIQPKGPCSNKRNSKKDRNAPISEVSLLIKKQLEENIVISDDFYSEHVSRIRKLRHGELIDTAENPLTVRDVDSELSVNSDLASRIVQESSHILCPDAPEWEGSGLFCQDLPDEDDTVALTLDSDFADQLHGLFGTVPLPFSQAGVKPSLNLPLSLARQLHYYLMEAEQNTYDLMMQEDEELARKLQLQEDEGNTGVVSSNPNQVPDLREIMDMEMALALYKADQEQNSHESKDDMATKLTKDLLCDWFPTLPRDVLVNVFEAHNGSFEDTIEVLIASTEEDNSVRVVMTPEARAAHEKALLQKANLESQKSKESSEPHSVSGEKTTQEKALKDAEYYRSEASRHYKLRYECQQKAQKTFQRGLTAAAAYYSQMASLHKERIEKNNSLAASSLLLAHSLGNLTTTLDLHFLYVVEALQVLDIFLDRHISQLFESGHRHEHLFVITGRGARSSGGRSRIKPAVIQRLEQRGLRHLEVNPGLLKVTITRNTTSSIRISS